MKIWFSCVLFFCASMPLIADWTDISAAIASREAQMVPAATGESSGIAVGPLGPDAEPVEYVADGRVLDTFFWHETFAAFMGITCKRHPGLRISFK